ncbi:MAG TPA: YMGG-like glycine zipper-containing protein [Dissulfurispiraceae bacterium]|nr:YMGG-like glycine zipper-containing protein [Dissulfurispiraceae bacterium]
MGSRGSIVLLFALLAVLLTISGCATVPTGPSVMALPGQGKPFEVFQEDDAVCRQWAAQQIGQTPQETVNNSTATGAVVGTAVGAGLGAAIGAAGGHVGTGAAIGAGTGLLVGTAAGANAGQVYGRQAQRRYDIAYIQCMYAKGNQVPGARRVQRLRRVPPPPPPPPDFDSEPPVYPAPPSQ